MRQRTRTQRRSRESSREQANRKMCLHFNKSLPLLFYTHCRPQLISLQNVIVHGLPESNNTSPHLARRDDSEGIMQIFNQILPSNYSELRLHRLRKVKGSSPQPLCVSLKSTEDARVILRNKFRYQGPCKITDDKTAVQRQGVGAT